MAAKNNKYCPLCIYLKASGKERVALTRPQVERILVFLDCPRVPKCHRGGLMIPIVGIRKLVDGLMLDTLSELKLARLYLFEMVDVYLCCRPGESVVTVRGNNEHKRINCWRAYAVGCLA